MISQDGLYNPQFEHDACGIGFVVNIDGKRTHGVIQQGLQILLRLTHRGACGCDPETGDGCGIMLSLPHALFDDEATKLGFALPAPELYGVAMVFLPQDKASRDACIDIVNHAIADEGQTVLGWRDVPTDSQAIGWLARENEPTIRQVFIQRADNIDTQTFERRLYVIRKVAEGRIRSAEIDEADAFYVPSCSARTIVYKGLMLPDAMDKYYADLANPLAKSSLALVHQRYSTNTLPSWPLAQPFRFLAHNGEINTLRGNLNMMDSREHQFENSIFGDDAKKLRPVLTAGASDSAVFDNAFELLVRGGRSVEHAMAMMIPEPWSGHETMPDAKKAFYQFHACKAEPWDGPASMAFSDGIRVGAVLDRNGLRPSRFWVTSDNQVIMASEVGVLDIPQEKIIRKGRLEPGRMFLVDTSEGRIVDDEEIKTKFMQMQPYRAWLEEHLKVVPKDLPKLETQKDEVPLLQRQQIFGYTQEDLEIIMAPMAQDGKEATGSMGNDAALAILSERPQLLFNYFKQLFAQVTNPPIDPIREEIVMSLETTMGRGRNLLAETPEDCRQLALKSPIITNAQLHFIKNLSEKHFKSAVVSTLFAVADGPQALKQALDRIARDAEIAVDNGAAMIVLSDRGINQQFAPIPSLLATGAVHHHLVRAHKRSRCGLIVETGEAREIMHFALLTGYGAGAVNPYLAFEAIEELVQKETVVEKSPGQAQQNYLNAIDKGLLKVMSKIGISTQHSYRCAQIFEAIGLGQNIIDQYFAGSVSRIGGIGLDKIARETLMRHAHAYPPNASRHATLDTGGQYRWRRRGEYHQWNPTTIAQLQSAAQRNDPKTYKEFADEANAPDRGLATLRGLLKFKQCDEIPLDEVEPASEIVKRFCTGAMSYGSISRESHENLAIAMNRLGGRSNTGEGGEDPHRFEPDENGDLRRSAIKQVASGRFGVTNEYLVNADELQIKMAQGAKPGEGGQLPGHKVFPEIAKVRYATPGVELISPPPHHDIYSIEDLAQLIHDLKNANIHSNISVKDRKSTRLNSSHMR